VTDPVALVDRYLQLCEDREVEAASAHLSPSVRIQFPAGQVYGSLGELVAAPKSYTWVRKMRDRLAVGTEGDATVVTSIGRLYGEKLDGTPFEDIRYVDVFVVRDGLIVEQLVWNDLSENGFRVPVPAGSTSTAGPGTDRTTPPLTPPHSSTRQS
jgi:hypothetical protein